MGLVVTHSCMFSGNLSDDFSFGAYALVLKSVLGVIYLWAALVLLGLERAHDILICFGKVKVRLRHKLALVKMLGALRGIEILSNLTIIVSDLNRITRFDCLLDFGSW